MAYRRGLIKKILLSSIVASGFAATLVAAADARPNTLAAFTVAFEKAPPPKGWDAFCARNKSDCKPDSRDDSEVSSIRQDDADGIIVWPNKTTHSVMEAADWIAFDRWSYTTADVEQFTNLLEVKFIPPLDAAQTLNWMTTLGLAYSEPVSAWDNEASPNQATEPSGPRKIELDPTAWKTITSVNDWVNSHIKPVTDMKHFGTVNKWVYPNDGKGDCKAYTLLKRRKLIDAGFPSEALLITIVWTKQNQGHAVLMARTTTGDYILDNLSQKVLLWNETTHDYVKRQSESDPNTWVYIDGDGQKQPVVAFNLNK